MRSQYDRINDLLIKYKYLFDLDLFISKQKNEFPPFIINEELILFQVNNFEIENTEHRLHISDDIYIIELIKVSDSELFYFSFKWINPPTEWRYDLKILLYYKDKNNQYVNLMNSPTEVTIQDNFKVICSINLKEKVLSIKKSEFNLSETFNESNGNRNNSIENKYYNSEHPTQDYLELKIQISKVNYGFQEIVEHYTKNYINLNKKMTF